MSNIKLLTKSIVAERMNSVISVGGLVMKSSS